MKIAMFWDFDPQNSFRWDTPSGIYRELINAGHEVKKFPLPHYDKSLGFKIFLNSKFVPDFCFLMNAGKLREGEAYWNKSVLGNYPFVLEAGDEAQTYYDHIVLSNNSDLILSPDIRCVEMYKNRNLNAFWWTHWCDEEIFFEDKKQNIVHEVVSTMNGYRPLTFQASQILSNKFINKTGLFGKQNGEWLRSGKIILQEARYGEVTRRIFEGMGCDRLVVTNRLDYTTKMQDIFVDRQDIVYYDDANECVELIKYYLDNEAERKKIARNGYEKVLNNHTAKKRTEFLLEKIKEIL